jgi:branched-chain amino acid aminotransferase
VTGSGAGIVPIASFDGREVSQPEHPLIAALQEGYRERTRRSEYRTELYIGAP